MGQLEDKGKNLPNLVPFLQPQSAEAKFLLFHPDSASSLN